MEACAGCRPGRLMGYMKLHPNVTILVVAAMILFLALAYNVSVNAPANDVLNFYAHAEAMKAGQIPYKDFVFEFPPFSLVFFLIPSFFTSDVNVYAALFGVQIVIFTLVCLYFMLRLCERMDVNRVFVSVLFLILILIYFTEMVKKFDMIPAAFVMASLYFFVERRFGWAYGLMMCATLIKIYPFFLILLFLVLNLLENVPRHRENVIRGFVACVIVGLVAVIPLLALSVSFSDIMSFLTFHTDRGFQVESVMGVIIQALGLLGLTSFSIVSAHDTSDVVGPISDAVLPYWNFLCAATIVVVLLLVLSYMYRRHEDGLGWNTRSLMLMALVVLLAFILTNKVFSTQYMLWIIPFLVVLPMIAGDRRLATALALILVVMEVCARWLLLYSPGVPEFVILNVVRDVILVAVFLVGVRYLLGNGGSVARAFVFNRADVGSE